MKSDINNLYYEMLRIRRVEERIAEEYKKQEMRCPVHLCIGQEAIAVGVCGNLSKSDFVFSNHRSHGHYLAKGGDLKKMIAEIYGKETGCCLGRGGSQHLIDLSVNFLGSTPIVGGVIPLACGCAFASALKKERNITAVFMGDAVMEEGATHEMFNFASLKKLPVLFVCENNLYSTSTPIRMRQPEREIFLVPKAHGVFSQKSDGNDVEKVYKITRKAADFVRKGKGPAFVEFTTYRQREHCGPDAEEPGIRPKEEIERWMKKDPLNGFEKYVSENLQRKIEKEIDDAFEYAKKSPFPKEEVREEDVYAA